MRIRIRVITFFIAGAIACGVWSAPALAASSHASCSSSKSSSGSTYGGQGTQITPLCAPTTSSTLPFTGLDIGLLVAAGAVLVATGLVLRWRLRHGAQ